MEPCDPESPLFTNDEESESEAEAEISSDFFDGEDIDMLSPNTASSAVARTPMAKTDTKLVSDIMPVVVRIETRLFGPRLEYVQVPAFDKDEQLLSVLNVETVSAPGWASDKLRVSFNAPAFDCAWDNGELHIKLPEIVENVVEVSMRPFLMSSNYMISYNDASEFKIQNACGFWDMPTPRNLKATTAPLLESSALRRLENKRQKHEMRGNRIQQDAVHSIAGTFMVSKNKNKVDFRGVRSYKLLEEDFLLLLGNTSHKRMVDAGITCSIYMLLLRGNLGCSLDLKALKNYLLLRTMGGWGSAEVKKQEDLVCNVAIMERIKWDFPRWSGDHSMVEQGVASLEISRKGGTVMRIVFPKGTLWDANSEKEVLASCAAMMRGMREIMRGGL